MIRNIALLCCLGLLSLSVNAANIVIIIDDAPGEGFNDPNPPTNPNQKGNNPGTTLGEMRLNLFNAAKTVWEQAINSNQQIAVLARFDALTCSSNSGTLGSAGATSSVANAPGMPADTAYPIALAEAISNDNFNGSNAEISTTFNSLVDSDSDCLGGGGFYYGLDNNAPSGTTALFSVVLHELGHGLGFASISNANGQFVGAGGFPDTFSRNLFDVETGEQWDEMTPQERAASSLNDPDLVWTGPQVTADQAQFLDGAVEMEINSPPGIAGTYIVTLGQEASIVLDGSGVTANVVDGDSFMVDCNPIFDAATNGAILLFEDDPACFSPFRAYYTESFDNGVGVLISNDEAQGDGSVAGIISNQDPTIPYVGITQAQGDEIRANLPGANVTLRRSASTRIGTQDGKVRMYAPPAFEQGSSVSHWSTDASPNLLMEPSLGALGFGQTDLTVAAFKDMGWSVNLSGMPPTPTLPVFKDGFEDVP